MVKQAKILNFPSKANRTCHITKDCESRVSKPSQENGDGRKRKFDVSTGAGGRSSCYNKSTKIYNNRNTEEDDSDVFGNMFTEVIDDSDKKHILEIICLLYIVTHSL
jgi:hypothetical protein